MRIALFAYSSTGVRVLETLIEIGERVVAVFTHPDDPGEKVWFESVAAVARRHGIPVHLVCADNPRGPVPYRGLIEEAKPDLILSASFRALIPESVLTLAPLGALNFHPSLLPRYRGRAPVNWVLVHGETETGMTLHHMVREPDAGDIVAQVHLPIGPDETAPELQKRMEDAAAEIVRRHVPEIRRGRACRIPQDPARSSYFGRRRPRDGRFEWTWPARRIHDLVRAVTRPYPGAFVIEPDGSRLVVWKTRRVTEARGPSLSPGEHRSTDRKGDSPDMGAIPSGPEPPAGRAFVAGTGDGLLEVLDWERRPAGGDTGSER